MRSCAPATRPCRPRSRSPRRTGTTRSIPGAATFELRGQVFARGAGYSCAVYVAPGSQPNNDPDTASTPGDFKRVPSSWCNGDVHTSAFDGVLADVDVQELKVQIPRQRGQLRRPRARDRRADLERAPEHRALRLHGEGRRAARPGRRSTSRARTGATCTCTATRTCCPGFPSDIGGARRRRVVTDPRRPRRRQPQ